MHHHRNGNGNNCGGGRGNSNDGNDKQGCVKNVRTDGAFADDDEVDLDIIILVALFSSLGVDPVSFSFAT